LVRPEDLVADVESNVIAGVAFRSLYRILLKRPELWYQPDDDRKHGDR